MANKDVYIAPYMSQTNQRQCIMAETRLSVHVYDSWQYQTVQFLSYAKKCWEVGRIYSCTTVSSRQKER